MLCSYVIQTKYSYCEKLTQTSWKQKNENKFTNRNLRCDECNSEQTLHIGYPENRFHFWFTNRIFFLFFFFRAHSVVWLFAFEYWPWIYISEPNADEKWEVDTKKRKKKSIPEHNYLFHYQSNSEQRIWIKETL